MDDTAFDPAATPAPASYHWTPRLQRDFLEAFATNGSVKISAAKVGMSPSAVYQLKRRPHGAAFRLGCAAAVLIARGRLVDELLDRMVEERARAGEEMLAQVIAGDWPGFLSLFDAAAAARDGAKDAAEAPADAPDGLGAALALWLAGRDNRANPLASLWRDSAIANEVAQFCADSESDLDAEPTPEEEAAAMTVWADAETGELRTNFPPPDDFSGIEEGAFGDEDYERTLGPDEEEAWQAVRAADVAPLRKAGEIARRAFFGLPQPANDPAPTPAKARKSASS